MRLPSLPHALLGLALACSVAPGVAQLVDPSLNLGDDDDDTGDSGGDDSGDSGDDEGTPLDTGGGGGDDTGDILHPVCDGYLACLAEVAPEEVASATEAYGADSACWAYESTASTCEAQCAELVHPYWVANPGAMSCYDGTDIPSNQVILQSTWYTTITEVDGPMCSAWFSYVTSYTVTFEPNETSSFLGTFNGSGWSNTIDCTNRGTAISCLGVVDDFILYFEGEVSDDFSRLTGVLADDVYCSWTLDSG